jgi:hypothetical protein
MRKMTKEIADVNEFREQWEPNILYHHSFYWETMSLFNPQGFYYPFIRDAITTPESSSNSNFTSSFGITYSFMKTYFVHLLFVKNIWYQHVTSSREFWGFLDMFRSLLMIKNN